MSTIATLVNRVRSDANVQDTENVDSKLPEWVLGAIQRHCPDYASSPSIPTIHDEALITLAWESLCYFRASVHVNTPESVERAPGMIMGKDANKTSPYGKNMDMAVKLRKRYSDIVAQMSTSGPGEEITQGKLFIESNISGTIPAQFAPNIIVSLISEQQTPTTVVLRWSFTSTPNFAEAQLYYTPDGSEIYQDWNGEENDFGVPKISDSAVKQLTVQDELLKAARMDSLTPAASYRFLVVVKATTGRFYYSNEIVVVTPAA